jgi:hypothetical protein
LKHSVDKSRLGGESCVDSGKNNISAVHVVGLAAFGYAVEGRTAQHAWVSSTVLKSASCASFHRWKNTVRAKDTMFSLSKQ